MSTVEEIRAAIQRLSLEERAQITAELCGWSDDSARQHRVVNDRSYAGAAAPSPR
jgi:hypothetical protein